MTDTPQEPGIREAGPNLPRWSLAAGNFVHVYWVNSMARTVETQGVIRETGDVITITPTPTAPLIKATRISVSRVRHVDVIAESEAGRNARKRAWELLKEAAGYLNRRSTWEPVNFFGAMEELAHIFPELLDMKVEEQ